jgi:hypothetical protein
VARSPSREWSEGFFGLCAEVLETLRSEGDDPRVAMTLPKNERDVLRVNVNGREVLSAHRRDSRSIGLILPVGVELPPDLEERIVWSYDFRPASDERWFAYFAVDDPGQLAPLREAWLSAVGDEGGRGVRSRYRRFHVVAFHRAVREAEYRRRLLDAAFSTQA